VAEPRLVCLSHLAPWPRRARAHRTRRTAATPRAPDPRPARAGRTLPRHLPDQHFPDQHLPDQGRRDRRHPGRHCPDRRHCPARRCPGLCLPVPVPARWERDRQMASCWTGSSCPRSGPWRSAPVHDVWR